MTGNLYVKVAHVEVQDDGTRYGMGDEPITETAHETPGAIFRAALGRDPRRPWEAMGRCSGKVYVDVPGSPCTVCHLSRAEHIGPVIVTTEEPSTEHPNGAVVSHGHHYQPVARHIGWVFERRERYEDDPTRSYLHERWVTVHTAPDSVTRTEHFADL